MATDWFGIALATLIILALILIIIAKIQGDRVVDVLRQIADFIKGD